MMKPGAFLVLIASAATLCAGTSPIPERLPKERYQKLKTDGPFAIATVTVEAKPVETPWSQGVHLNSIMRSNAEDGSIDMEKSIITLSNANEGGTIVLRGTTPYQGYQLVKVNWNDNPALTTVDVSKDGETAKLDRDQAAFRSPAPPQQSITRPGQPPNTMVPNAGGAIRPPNQPNPQNRPQVIPRPPTNVQQPVINNQPKPVQGSQNPQGQQPGSERRRVRVIGR